MSVSLVSLELIFSNKIFIFALNKNHLTLGLGISMPATTIRLVGTNEDILKGRNIGSPVSG